MKVCSGLHSPMFVRVQCKLRLLPCFLDHQSPAVPIFRNGGDRITLWLPWRCPAPPASSLPSPSPPLPRSRVYVCNHTTPNSVIQATQILFSLLLAGMGGTCCVWDRGALFSPNRERNGGNDILYFYFLFILFYFFDILYF